MSSRSAAAGARPSPLLGRCREIATPGNSSRWHTANLLADIDIQMKSPYRTSPNDVRFRTVKRTTV
jgi:hypothetical protein